MSGVFLGNNAVSGVYLGNTPAKAIYLGNELVWSGMQRPNEFYYDFTTKSPVSDLNGTTSDSGHTVACFGTLTGSIATSGGVNVYTQSTGAGATYLTTAAPLRSMVAYCAAEFRWFNDTGSKSTHDAVLGLISFAQATGYENSATHFVVGETAAAAQKTFNLTSFPVIGGPWSYSSPGQNWCFMEWAIYGNTVVVRLLDGSIETYTDSDVSGYWSCYPVFEPLKDNSTDFQPQFRKVWAASLEHIAKNPAQLAYYNALLAEAEVGPWEPNPGGPVLVATGSAIANSAPNASFVDLNGNAFTCQSGDLIVAMTFNDDSSTDPAPPSDYIQLGVRDDTSASGCLSYKVASGTESATGAIPDAATDAVGVMIFRGASGVGSFQSASASTTPTAFPSTTFSVTNGTSKAALFACRRGTPTSAPFSASSAASHTVARHFNAGTSGSGGTTLGLYESIEGMTGYPGANIYTTDAGWVCFVAEIKD